MFQVPRGRWCSYEAFIMDDTANVPDPKEAQPLQLAPVKPARKRKAYLKHKFASAIIIREVNPDRAKPRITKIPATLQDGKARMLIVATKILDRLEARIDQMADDKLQMSSKESKEFVEAVEKANALMKDAFGVEPLKAPSSQPVNNGIIVNGASEQVANLFSSVAKKATEKPVIDITPHDTGSTPPNP